MAEAHVSSNCPPQEEGRERGRTGTGRERERETERGRVQEHKIKPWRK
jgi:hypothetical protein